MVHVLREVRQDREFQIGKGVAAPPHELVLREPALDVVVLLLLDLFFHVF